MAKVFITGLGGFVGPHLARYCLKQGDEVFGTILPQNQKKETENLKEFGNKLGFFPVDLKNKSSVLGALSKTKPDIIFHLAALSSVLGKTQETITNNMESQANLFEALREIKQNPIILIAGSALEYGQVQESENPVKETTPLRPNSAYGISKKKQEGLALEYYQKHGLPVIVSRAFNHTGPGQQAGVAPSFARQIAQIELGLQESVMKVGNLEVIRDFTDVRDMVRAYYLATQFCDPGQVYNIGSGKGYAIKHILELLLSFSQAKIKVQQDESLLRDNDIVKLVADSSKFRAKTNWQPEIKIETTLLDVLSFFRDEYKNKKN